MEFVRNVKTFGARSRGFWLMFSLELTAVLLWLPSILWPFTISWDENTFFLVAQRLLHGELPYTTTFENKSPLGLVFQSGAMAIVGPSPLGLRLISALLLGATAFLLVSAAPKERFRFLTAYLVGALFILLWVNLTNGLVWMSEINVVLIFALAWSLFVRQDFRRPFVLVGLGLVIGLLPLVRVNWAFVALILFVGVWLEHKSLRNFFLLLTGALVPLAGTLAAYALTGSLQRLWAGMVALPRGLGDGEGWALPTLHDDQLPLFWLGTLMLIASIQLIVLRMQWISSKLISSVDLILLVVTWALSLGAWIQPYDFPYQTLQILPLLALSISRLIDVSGPFKAVFTLPLVIACFSLIYLFWGQVITSFDWRNSARQESNLVTFLSELPGIEEKSLWVPDTNNFLYWRLEKKPIIPLASQPYLVWEKGAQRADLGYELSESEASQYVFDNFPDLIVANSDYAGSYNQTPEAEEVWDTNIKERYRLIASIDGRTVWELIPEKR